MIVVGESKRQGLCEMQKKREKVNEKLDVPRSSWSQVRWVPEMKRDIQIKMVLTCSRAEGEKKREGTRELKYIPGKIIIS